MQAVILAAGMGRRLKNLTKNNTKCMVKVNGITLIERMLRILDRKGLSRIVVVVGYEREGLISYINTLNIKTPIRFIDNKIYHKTNNIYSLALAKEYLITEDTLILESDLIFEEEVIDILMQDERETLALVDKFESWMDGTCMILDDDDSICEFISGKYLKFNEKDKYYKTVNIYKFSQHFLKNTYVPFLEAYKTAMGNNEYYESVIKLIAMLDTKEIRAKRLEGQVWYEIDDIQDLDIASSLFATNDMEKYDRITKRYGGYWRYPKLLDFCYLVNPYYPPPQMIEEIKANFETLVTQYPSGMKINSLIASKNFGVGQDYIVIGNGAAELIQILMRSLQGKAGFVRPTFDEYPNRYDKENSIYMSVDNEEFTYSVKDIIDFFEVNPVNILVIVNPDNPSGNYINMGELKKLIAWCRQKRIKLIIDESFVDFVDNGDSLEQLTLISDDILETYQEGLFVIKSISKSYGIPGMRLGVMASANTQMIKEIKERISIWNINSFGEFYMQIAEKYNKDYVTAISKIKNIRNDFFNKLKQLPILHAIPSQANYVMCEIIDGTQSIDMACYLLRKNILIKDLSEKIGNGKQYIRLAIRRKEENDYLIKCLEKYMLYEKQTTSDFRELVGI